MMKCGKTNLILGLIIIGIIAEKVIVIATHANIYRAESMQTIFIREMGFYEKYVKRSLDMMCVVGVLLFLWPLYVIIALMVRVKLGAPILFIQDRPGLIDADGKETIFKMYKFRTMTNEKDSTGNLLSDEKRLTKFGAWLRSTSLDELPEVFNIVNGTMSVIGPRPQLVKDLVFMTPDQRRRHTAKPGLSGLAQVNGRNSISWEQKFVWDLKYVEHVSVINDFKILIKTIEKAIVKRDGITGNDMATAEDLGDYLLRVGKIDYKRYEKGQKEANNILRNRSRRNRSRWKL